MKHEVCMIWTSDQMRRIWMKNMKIIHNNKKNAFILIKKFHQDHSSWSASAEWVKKKIDDWFLNWNDYNFVLYYKFFHRKLIKIYVRL